MEVRKVPARGEMVEVTLTFTAEEWEKIQNNAHWSGLTTEQYLRLGQPTRRGC